MTISITKKIALSVLITGVTFSGQSSSVQAMDVSEESSAQLGTRLSSMDNRAESISDFLAGMEKMKLAYSKAPEHLKSNLNTMLNLFIHSLNQPELKVSAHAVSDVPNLENGNLPDGFEHIIGVMPGVHSVQDITPEIRLKARVLRVLNFRLDDPVANQHYDRMTQAPDLTTAPNFTDSEERRAALMRGAAQDERPWAGQGADVQYDADLVKLGCPVTAETLNAKTWFADKAYTHINRANPVGADYYAAAALELAGNTDPVLNDYNIVRHIANYILSEPKISKLPPSADIAHHALRLWPEGAEERIALMHNHNLLQDFAEGVLGAIYLEEVLGYQQLTFDPAGLQHLKILLDAITELRKLGFMENTGNPLTAVPAHYVDAMIQMLRPALRAQILGAADAKPTHSDVILMATLRQREKEAGGHGFAPEADSAIRAVDFKATQ